MDDGRQETTVTKQAPRVLVVDDEPYLCDVVRRILEKEGYEVATVPDGQRALDFIERQEPDVILLDIMMPGLDGREVCRRVRARSPKTQVIYFTARAEPVGLLPTRQLRREADALIIKPASSRLIVSKLERVLHGGRQEAAKRPTSVPAALTAQDR